MNEQALNKKTSVLRKSGAALLVAWGGLHAYGAVVLSRDAAQQPLIPNLFLPRWPFYDVIIFSALLAATGGIALWLDRRWGLGVSSVGVLGLWGAPLYFEVHHFGWSELDALTYLVKLAAAVVILAPPIASRLRRRSQPSEVSYSPITLVVAFSLPAFVFLVLVFMRISSSMDEKLDPNVVTVDLELAAGDRRLPSGNVVTVLSVRKTVGEQRSSSFRIEYQTEIPAGDNVALVQEINELWAEFRRLLEAETVDFATIIVHGFGTGHEIYFPITRGDDGVWRTPRLLKLEPGSKIVVYDVREHLDALWVDYVMAVPTRDQCVAMAEAVQVWAEYREIAESRGLSKAYLSPSQFPPRIIVSALAERGFGLTVPLTRGDDGQWKWHGRGPCVVEVERSYVQELPFGADDSIAGIQLQNPNSAREVMVNPEPETTADSGFTRYRYTNGGADEVITFSQHPGVQKYSIAVVRVTKATGDGLVPVFPGRPIQFISGRGIRVGLTENEVRSILGEPTAESEGTLIYQFEGDKNPEWLEKHNMPEYRGTYRFEGGKLVTFEFGFPYP